MNKMYVILDANIDLCECCTGEDEVLSVGEYEDMGISVDCEKIEKRRIFVDLVSQSVVAIEQGDKTLTYYNNGPTIEVDYTFDEYVGIIRDVMQSQAPGTGLPGISKN